MAAEALVLQKLLEVVWHANEVELDLAIFHVDPCRVHISKYHAFLVHMRYPGAQLPED